ncbi:MAG: hypothetical protein JWM98_1981 [Thermoleophilia bacterium]|nr:hypothetical protein [Thermoleophilia bacterium]
MRVILPQTYGVGPHAESPTAEMLRSAGLLFAGRGARLSGPTAGAVTGVWSRGSDEVHVSAPGLRKTRLEPFVFHRTQTERFARRGRVIDGFAVPHPLDLCADLARSLSSLQLAHVVDRSRYQELVTLEGIDALCEQWAGVPFVTVLREARDLVRGGSAGTRSVSEDILHQALLRAGIPPTHVNVRGILGVPSDEPDFVWLDRRLNVEVDGRQHDEPEQRALDGARDEVMRSLGIRVTRFRAADVRRRPGWVVQQIRAALRAG